jgi:catechol 2,3-dioxygenase-like lactoylglutathione lyase family enzyme
MLAGRKIQALPGVDCWRMALRVEKISAVTLRVANMRRSVRFYGDVLGMELVYGGEDAFFSSLRAKVAEYPILNLEQGRSVTGWGARMIFYVADVDAFWEYLRGKGFNRKTAGCVMGRTVFPHARSGRPRVVVCASDLAVLQQVHELIRREEQFAEVVAQR